MVFVDGDNGQQQQGGGGAALTQLSIRVHPMLGGGTPRRRLSSASRGKCLAAVWSRVCAAASASAPTLHASVAECWARCFKSVVGAGQE